VGPALLLSVMLVAAISVHWKNGLFAGTNGIEVPLLYATGALALALTGPGLFSLDAVLGIANIWTPALKVAVLAAGALGGAVNLLARRHATVAATA
jgi:putative oxidoreductase